MNNETAYLAGGSFWGMQYHLRRLDGVIFTRTGYTGGSFQHATYRNHPGHAQAVEVVFDNSRIDYRAVLEFFFQIHDSTTLNQQGEDVGDEFRSAIFYCGQAQKIIATQTLIDMELSGLWPGPIVTEVTKAGVFWIAERTHQDYLDRITGGYNCHFVRSHWRLPALGHSCLKTGYKEALLIEP
ncbi:hypothetical protein N185_15585 [Sinorhizobium sp. GW3]|nr:hypothetical protein N185_15585 [Sinorhizobium sp. GW3]